MDGMIILFYVLVFWGAHVSHDNLVSHNALIMMVDVRNQNDLRVAGATPERRGGAHMGLPERIYIPS